MILDMHVHTKIASPCGRNEPSDIVRMYKEKGYDGIVVTDHFIDHCMRDYYGLDYNDYCDLHRSAYEKTKAEGDKIGLTVLYGAELRLRATGENDYLVYGMTTDFFKANPDIFDWSVERLKDECETGGFVFYQAHPFRTGMTVSNPFNLYGIEVYNGKVSPKDCDVNRNILADIFADKYELHKIAGSDCHGKNDLGTAGIFIYKDIRTENELVGVLKNDEYRIFHSSSYTK